MMPFPLRLNPVATSKYLREVWGIVMAPKTLRNRTCLGTGPQWAYWGCRPYTTPALIDEWVQANLADAPANRSRPKRGDGEDRSGIGEDQQRPIGHLSASEDEETEGVGNDIK